MSNIINSYRYGGAAPPAFSFGNALQFDGLNDYVSIPTTITAQNIWSMSCWFKIDSFGLGSSTIASSTSANYQFGQITSNTVIRIRVTLSANFTVPIMSIGVWYHLLLAVNGTTAKLYLNGVESSSGSLNAGISIARPEQLGRNQPISTKFHGLMDEIIFETGVQYGLTDAQNLYNSGSGVASDSIITNPDWYYKLDESGATTTAVDSSGNGYNGTLNNFPASGMWVTH